ncbi:YgeY family selenium metabolism-linked hydrolase [Nocardia grenadensis]|uniref:YgeY family selenium metabolism-linked hydrolase n=1 Tax=Nocardia grenadensis TaxID=931537 RepID=UPI0007A3B6A5|nr:YgeY family selenium metabolism-linked hydrolase [Nocardia grenadensis]
MGRAEANARIDRDGLRDFLLRLLAARSPATAEEPAVRVLTGELAALGFAVTTDDWGNVIGTLRFGPGPVVLVDCHLDTVEVTDPQQWSHSPWGEVAGGVVYGRGTVDMKSALAAVVYGAKALPPGLRGTVVVAGTVCEELIEGPALGRVLEQVRPDVVVIGEPSGNRLMLGQRGRAEVSIEVIGRSSHSAYPEAGVNAAEVMADVITAVRDLEFPHHPDPGPAMIALTNLKSEPYPNVSVVPDRCVATYDRRTVLGESAADVLEPLRDLAGRIAGRDGARVEIDLARSEFTTWTGVVAAAESFAPAWCMPATEWPAAESIRALEAAGLDPRPGYYQFCTNGSASAGRHAIPTLGFGPGDPGRAHTTDESIDLDDLYLGAYGYSVLLRALLAAETE